MNEDIAQKISEAIQSGRPKMTRNLVRQALEEGTKVDDVLTALYISAVSDENAARAVAQLPKLRGCDLHSTQILYSGDESTLRKMGIHVTCDPVFPEKSLFI